MGITRGTKKAHIARAILEGMALQVYDIVKAMENDFKTKGMQLRVDGGAASNNLLLQIQADMFNFKVVRPKMLESTATGVAYLAGLAVGFWKNISELKTHWHKDRVFESKVENSRREVLLKIWHKAIDRAKKLVVK